MITTKIVSAISLAAILAIGSYAGWTWYKLQRAETKIVNIESDLRQTEAARDAAINANRTNLETIDQLMLEKMAIEKSLSQLESDRRRNQQLINNLSASIRAMAADPANQVELSPVLKQTVESIQRQRQERSSQ